MGERKSRQEMNEIKERHNVFDAYSWSRYATWKRDTYEYFLKYILRAREDRSNSIYGCAGGYLHDMKEDYYLGKLEREIMPSMYMDEMNKLEALGFKFDRTDKSKNDNIAVKYFACNEHFLKNFIPMVQENMLLEEFIEIKVGNFLFIGYVDESGIEKINGRDKMIITDFKTSSLYKGEKIIKERGQLLLYALGKIQDGWNTEDVIIRWLFTKYVDIDVPYKNSFRTRTVERNAIGSSLVASIRVQLRKLTRYKDYQVIKYLDRLYDTKSLKGLPNIIYEKYDDVQLNKDGSLNKNFVNGVRKFLLEYRLYDDDEISELIEMLIIDNSLESMPEQIKKKYTIRDCFVEIPFDMDDINELTNDMKKFVLESNKLSYLYSKTKDDSLFYQEVDGDHSYYMANLCGYSAKLHKPYADYLENRKMKIDEPKEESETEDMLALYKELGIDLEN